MFVSHYNNQNSTLQKTGNPRFYKLGKSQDSNQTLTATLQVRDHEYVSLIIIHCTKVSSKKVCIQFTLVKSLSLSHALPPPLMDHLIETLWV